MCKHFDYESKPVKEIDADVDELWRYAGGIKQLSQLEQQIWRLYCYAKRCMVSGVPNDIQAILAYISEQEDEFDRALAWAKLQAKKKLGNGDTSSIGKAGGKHLRLPAVNESGR